MKFTKKSISNIVFVVIIGLLLYPPTKVYFIRLISFSPSTIKVDKREQLTSYNWNLKGLNTASIHFNQVKNKVVFVSFWATWCPPCRAEMLSIQELYNDYNNKVEFVFVSNEDWSVVSDFYRKNGYELPTYNSLNKRPEEFNSETIPATFIVDKKGAIAMMKKGPANWNSTKVRDLLNSLLK